MKLLYIAGTGRSGSTLLERMLAQAGPVHPLGEVAHLWNRGVAEDQLCGCGRRFSACPFWSEVTRLAFDDLDPEDGRRLAELRVRAVARPGSPLHLMPALLERARAADRAEYRRQLARLYRAAAQVSGADVLVDSSKYPGDAMVVRDLAASDLQVYVLHLVRDSNAVVHAWQKRKRRPEIHWHEEDMPRYPWWLSALAWSSFNRRIDGFARDQRVGYLRLRYEDLVREPGTRLDAVLAWLGIVGADLSFIRDGRVHLAASHTVSGNPSRFEVGAIPLRVDDAWRAAVRPAQRRAVEILTASGRRRYGYAEAEPT